MKHSFADTKIPILIKAPRVYRNHMTAVKTRDTIHHKIHRRYTCLYLCIYLVPHWLYLDLPSSQ